MEEIQYKSFSLKTHKKNWLINRPNVCQFELTFRCGLRCKHCYTDCYNKPAYLKKELNTKQIKLILDKVYNAGVIWVCFTGGDPLTRRDFLDIYTYAKKKGFIVSIFTNACSMNKKIADYLEKYPPFVIEMTLNGATKETYEKISRVKGSFEKAMRGIQLMRRAEIPLKIKTQVTRDNFPEVNKIKKFILGMGLEFKPSIDLHARLNGDLSPCDLRLSVQQVFKLNGKKKPVEDDCLLNKQPDMPKTRNKRFLFRCAAGGGDGFNVDPYGNTFACNLIRKPAFNLLRVGIKEAMHKSISLVRGRVFVTNSKCKACRLINSCRLCPGRAYVETGDMEAPVDYYCQLALASSS